MASACSEFNLSVTRTWPDSQCQSLRAFGTVVHWFMSVTWYSGCGHVSVWVLLLLFFKLLFVWLVDCCWCCFGGSFVFVVFSCCFCCCCFVFRFLGGGCFFVVFLVCLFVLLLSSCFWELVCFRFSLSCCCQCCCCCYLGRSMVWCLRFCSVYEASSVSSSSTLQIFQDACHLWWLFCPPLDYPCSISHSRLHSGM